MLGIIGAMDKELNLLANAVENKREETIASVSLLYGKLFGRDVVMVQCGIGKVAAAMAAQTMVLQQKLDAVLMVGIAGGLVDNSNIQAVAAKQLVQHDIDTTLLGDAPGLISPLNCVYLPCDARWSDCLRAGAEQMGLLCSDGVIASGDQFIYKEQDRQRIHNQFAAVACDMESGAVGQVCYSQQVPFAVLRLISDNGGESAKMDYETFTKHAAEKIYAVMQAALA